MIQAGICVSLGTIVLHDEPGMSNGSTTPNAQTPKNLGTSQFETSRHGSKWVEQDEPGVYITLVSAPGGFKDLKRVRFSFFRIVNVQEMIQIKLFKRRADLKLSSIL